MGKRWKEAAKVQIVREALSGIKVGTLSRMYDVHPETLRRWVREYQDTVSLDDIPPADEHLQEIRRLQDVELKFEQAKKLIGEKELEIEVLRELLKKKNPAYSKDSK